MNQEETSEEVFRIFHALNILLKNGQFTKRDLDYMERMLEAALDATKKVKERAEKKQNEG